MVDRTDKFVTSFYDSVKSDQRFQTGNRNRKPLQELWNGLRLL